MYWPRRAADAATTLPSKLIQHELEECAHCFLFCSSKEWHFVALCWVCRYSRWSYNEEEKSEKCRNKTMFLSNNGGKSIRLGQFVRSVRQTKPKTSFLELLFKKKKIINNRKVILLNFPECLHLEWFVPIVTTTSIKIVISIRALHITIPLYSDCRHWSTCRTHLPCSDIIKKHIFLRLTHRPAVQCYQNIILGCHTRVCEQPNSGQQLVHGFANERTLHLISSQQTAKMKHEKTEPKHRDACQRHTHTHWFDKTKPIQTVWSISKLYEYKYGKSKIESKPVKNGREEQHQRTARKQPEKSHEWFWQLSCVPSLNVCSAPHTEGM